MSHLSKYVPLFVALLLPTLSLAQSASELYEAARKMEQQADKQLNAAYQHLLKSIDLEGGPNATLAVERLRASQRAWLKYRDAQVTFVATYADVGSSSSRAAGNASYSVELTKARVKDLENVPNPF